MGNPMRMPDYDAILTRHLPMADLLTFWAQQMIRSTRGWDRRLHEEARQAIEQDADAWAQSMIAEYRAIDWREAAEETAEQAGRALTETARQMCGGTASVDDLRAALTAHDAAWHDYRMECARWQ